MYELKSGSVLVAVADTAAEARRLQRACARAYLAPITATLSQRFPPLPGDDTEAVEPFTPNQGDGR